METLTLLPWIAICRCNQHPCSHFSLSDYAMLCEKTEYAKKIIEKEFNFSTFVRNVTQYFRHMENRTFGLDQKTLASCLIHTARAYGVNMNDIDPENGKIFLHYTNWMREEGYGDVYDFEGLPANTMFNRSWKNYLRYKIKAKSEKLFQLIYFDKVPQRMSLCTMNKIMHHFLRSIDKKQLETVLTHVKDYKGNTLLHIACKMNNIKVTEFILLNYPKLQHVKNVKGKTAKEYATDCLCLFGNLVKYNSRQSRWIKREILDIKDYPIPLYDLKEIILHFDSETIFQFSRKARDYEGNNVWHSYTVWFNENPEYMDEIFRHFDPTIINDKNVHDITPLQMAQDKLVFNKLVGYGARVINTIPKQNNPNFVRLQNVNLCECQLYPCFHFSLGDYAMMCEKNDYVREVIRLEFNFAIFVKNLMRTNVNIEYVRIAIDYGIDVNQRDPANGKTAMHYMSIYSIHEYYLHKYVNSEIDIDNVYDNKGKPHLYHSEYFSGESYARRVVRNEKVFRYFYNNEIPTHWTDTMIHSLILTSFKFLPPEKCRYIFQNICDRKGNNFLHLATKYGKYDKVDHIIKLDPNLALKRNAKGKLPIAYAKYFAIFQLLSPLSNEFKWYRKLDTFKKSFRNRSTTKKFELLTMEYPELIELIIYNKPTLVHNMDKLRDLLLVLSPEYILKISKRAYDLASNNIWHHYANCDPALAQNIFPLFDKSMINNRNVHGNTPLHVCKNEITRQILIEYGAHEDCLNMKNEMASNIVLNLQCIAARAITDFENVPNHLKDVIQLHHPSSK